MKYDLEADWNLLDTCNYRCTYCFLSIDRLGSKVRVHARPEEWRSAFDRVGGVWLLHLTGGEPSIYPDIVELCATLTQKHYISFNSNLTNASIRRLAERIDPSRVAFINAGFHSEERDRRSGHADFLRNAEALRARNFPLIVSIVATPRVLDRLPEVTSLLAPIGLVPVPKLLRGRFEGRQYPQDYTESEKERFRTFAAAARESYRELLSRMGERPSIDMFDDDQYLGGLPEFGGKPCHAGAKFVKIGPSGRVLRCGPRSSELGNLLEGTFVPSSEPRPCDTRACFYFCLKYTETRPAGIEAARAA
jgi:MoaA/NifB/PqqE/SkfB family radical SAM enzyme